MKQNIHLGWYNGEYAQYSFTDYEKAKEQYRDGIKERLSTFIHNPKYALDFYFKKICSMWTENTYSSLQINVTLENVNYDLEKNYVEYNEAYRIENYLVLFYQKALILLIFGCSVIAIIQNRKNLSNEVLLLLMIFIGGFLFHILWEAKSRYIIPYIVPLIPIAAIELKINKNKFNYLFKDIKKRKKNA